VLNTKHELASEEVAKAMDDAFAEWLEKESATQQEEPETDTEAEQEEPANRLSPTGVTTFQGNGKPPEWITTPAVVPPCPEPDPVSGTAGIDFMLWHAAHASKEKIIEIYGVRLNNKPTFLEWIKATPALAPFLARVKKL
jgi:hypothetical protein